MCTGKYHLPLFMSSFEIQDVYVAWTNVHFNFFNFVLYHITFKVELNSNMLYKKGGKIYNGPLLLGKTSK